LFISGFDDGSQGPAHEKLKNDNPHMSSKQRQRGSPFVRTAAVMTAALGVLLLPLPQEWSAGWLGECLNRLHAPLMGLACIALVSGRGSGLNSLRVALGALLAAALMECVQPWFGRTASMRDFGWGVAGVLGGTLWNLAKTTPEHARRGLAALLAVLFMLAPPGAWLAEVGRAVWQAHESFPELLGTPGRPLSLFWTVQPNKEQDTSKKAGRIVLLSRQDLPATAHLNVRGNDWSGFDGLEIKGELEADSAVEIGIRVDLDDAQNTKLRASGWMSPQQNLLRIPWPEGTPPGKVRQLVIFLALEAPAARLRLDGLRLIEAKNSHSEPSR
jgi:hypothetical protein